MMKGLRALLLLIVVLGVIAVGAASMWLGSLVKPAIERLGPEIVGAPVTVGAVVLDFLSGRGVITNIVIGNPPGFRGPHAMKVGSIEVKINIASLIHSQLVVVEKLAVRDPEIIFEVGPGGSNLQRLQRHAQGAGGKKTSPKDRSLMIREFTMTGCQVGVAASPLGRSVVTLPLPDVRLTDLGGRGHTPAESAARVLDAVAASVGKAVAGLGSKALDQAAAGVLGRLGGLLKGKR